MTALSVSNIIGTALSVINAYHSVLRGSAEKRLQTPVELTRSFAPGSRSQHHLTDLDKALQSQQTFGQLTLTVAHSIRTEGKVNAGLAIAQLQFTVVELLLDCQDNLKFWKTSTAHEVVKGSFVVVELRFKGLKRFRAHQDTAVSKSLQVLAVLVGLTCTFPNSLRSSR